MTCSTGKALAGSAGAPGSARNKDVTRLDPWEFCWAGQRIEGPVPCLRQGCFAAQALM